MNQYAKYYGILFAFLQFGGNLGIPRPFLTILPHLNVTNMEGSLNVTFNTPQFLAFLQQIDTLEIPRASPNRPPNPAGSKNQFGRGGPCACGRSALESNSRVVGGSEALPGEFPWRVGLLVGSENCTGTILTRQWILTAAHCFRSYYPGQRVEVLVGSVGQGGAPYQARFTRHESFNPSNVYRIDIALLKLDQKLRFDYKNIGPICLPFALTNDGLRGTVMASGWGRVAENGDTSERLRKATLDLIDNRRCQRVNGHFRVNGKPVEIDRSLICTFTPGRDTCQGDSGGSLDYKYKGKWYAVGIVSYGNGCARNDSAGINTRVTDYLNWIQDTTGI